MKASRLPQFALLVVTLWGAFQISAGARLPADPFERLLYRLDHAPINLTNLEKQTAKSREVEAAAAQFGTIMGPVTPLLEGVASSKTLSFLGQIPYLGGPVQAIRLGLQGTVEASRGFQWLVDREEKTLQPVNRAVRACAQLQQSRSHTDLPELVSALDGALGPLDASESALQIQDGKLRRLAATLAQLGPLLDQFGNAQGRGQSSLSQAAAQITAMSTLLQSAEHTVHTLRSWARRCANDARLAIAAGDRTSLDVPPARAAAATSQDGNDSGLMPRDQGGSGGGWIGSQSPEQPASSRPLAYLFILIALLGFVFTVYLWRSTRRRFASRVHPVNGPIVTAQVIPAPAPARVSAAPAVTHSVAWLETGDSSVSWRHHPLREDGKMFLGRLSAADLRLDDEQISGLHAAIEGREGRFTILDLDSSNGTHVNGLRVVNVPLQNGDVIKVGETEVTFRQSTTS